MWISRRLAISCLLLPATIDFATALPARRISSSEQICSRLIEYMGDAVMISQGVGHVPNDLGEIRRAVSPLALPLALQLEKLTFGERILKDIPEFGDAEWFTSGQFVASHVHSRSGRQALIAISPHGMIEITIWSSGSLVQDRAFSEYLITLLRRAGVEAMISARTGFLPHEANDGFELWISRLDANNPITRTGVARLLDFLKEN